MSDPKTQREATFFFDEAGRQATATIQMLAEKDDKTHPISGNNALEVLMGGEEAFKRIAADIGAAKHSIDIIAWGFDPGMELVRSGSVWPRGKENTYGALLDAAAARGVQVRLLVWKGDPVAGYKQNNMPGYTGDQEGGTVGEPDWKNNAKTPEDHRQHYCRQWWHTAIFPYHGKNYPLEVCFRAGGTAAQVNASLNRADSKEDPLSTTDGSHGGAANEKTLIENHATHHQKTILIDYGYEEGSRAVGYVMGLNSLTDYWDTTEHLFHDPLRETDWGSKSFTASVLAKANPPQLTSRDPLHDYVCRMRGPSLRGVQQNFKTAWKRTGGKATDAASDSDAMPARLKEVAKPGSQVQVVRTQPQENDKTIKNIYWQAVEFARDYIYIENQYFFYERWVRHFKAKRKAQVAHYVDCGGRIENSNVLHLFCVLPWPEDDGMVPRTFDTVKSLGVASSMLQGDHVKAQLQQYEKEQQDWNKQPKAIKANAAIPMPPSTAIVSSAAVEAPVMDPRTGELKDLRTKVLMARLISQNKGEDPIKIKPNPKDDVQQVDINFRQIYIHSKLMVVDDDFFTLGSANLNVRSMAADSEINVAVADHHEAKKLREMVWKQHTRSKDCVGGQATQKELGETFENWRKLMKANQANVNKGAKGGLITGFVVPFSDRRQISFRHG